MPAFPGFLGGTAQARSVNVNAERTINWYPEQAAGNAKAEPWLVPTPGLSPFAVLEGGPVRAIFAQDGRVFAVGGTGFYEVFATGTATLRGTVAADGQPATISSNGSSGNQVFVTSGGLGYIYDLVTNALTQIVSAGFPSPVLMGTFSDGYFIALKDRANQFNLSALLDGTMWDALDVYQVSTVAEELRALVVAHRDLWLFGSRTSSVWSNTGDADNVYQPIPGVQIDQGAGASFAAVRLDNAVFWLGQSEAGNRVVYRTNGYTPQRVSTHAVEFALSHARRIDDAIAWAYQEEGHTFYVLYVPDLENTPDFATTWVYDVAANAWHERALWDTVARQWVPHLGRCHTFGFGRHLVGDRLSPAIYSMRLGVSSDTQVLLGSDS
jgi:hypothetical protein